jgi:hypothetical protein
MDINVLAEKVGGEIVGGRLIAVVDGKKQYLTAVGSDGMPFLNELGLKISNELSFEAPAEPAEPAEPPEAPAPKRGRRKAEAAEVDVIPEQLELDL